MLTLAPFPFRRLGAALVPLRQLSTTAANANVSPPWLPLRESSPWNRSVVVDPHFDFFDNPAAQKHRKAAATAFEAGDSSGFADAAVGFLRACSELPHADPLRLSDFLLFIDGKSPVRAPLLDSWDMVHSTASYAAGIAGRGNNRSGFALAGDKGVGKSQLLQFCTVVPSILLDNVVGVYFDAKSPEAETFGLTPSVLLREALRRRLERSAVPLPNRNIIQEALKNGCTVDGLLSAARANQLAVVACVDEARATYDPASPSAASWSELHGLLQSFTACAFVADSTTMLPTLVRGTQSDVIKSELGYPEVRHSLNGDKMAVIPVDTMHTQEQYSEFLEGRCPDPEAIDLRDLHLSTSGRYRSIERFLSDQRSVPFDEDLNLPAVGDLGYTLLGRMLGLLRTEKHGAMTDPFEERWFPASLIMQWVQGYNKHHGTSLGYAAVIRLVEGHILRQRVRRSDTQDPEYTFGSPHQLRSLLATIPSVFVSFAWDDSVDTIEPMLKQFHTVDAISTMVCTSPPSAAFISTFGIRPFEHKEAMGVLDEENAFMLLVLTKQYLARLGKADSGVRREVTHAVELVKKGQGSKVVFASPDTTFAFESILPELPPELRELAGSSLIFNTADVRGLAERMTGVFPKQHQ